MGFRIHFFVSVGFWFTVELATSLLFFSLNCIIVIKETFLGVVGYPLAAFHRCILLGRSPALQHFYFTLCGISLCYFNFGKEIFV